MMFTENSGGEEDGKAATEDQRKPIEYKTFQATNFRLAVAHEEMNSRRRNTMEDVHRIIPELHESLPHYSFLGIYDGHGGRQIVDFLENALEERIAKEINHPDDATIAERVTRSFLITDMESRKLNITTSGATAVITLLHTNPTTQQRSILAANVGDSRAVLATKNRPANAVEDSESGYFALRMTIDHRADDPTEQKRINEAGGFVARNRVLGILAVARSFGDHGMKDFVIAVPHIMEVEIEAADVHPMLILACDGVWDVLSDQEAVDLLMPRYLAEGPFADAAQILVDASLEKGTSDNVTAVVAFL
ncbi:protein serine/threonine phosphatase 2C family protein [archaeon]|nr:MAG: protein serine/threonine phosphatase 2C family protein [archaeon]